MAKSITVSVPDIGDFSSVDVIEVFVSPGDKVSKEDSLIALETDKATMEVPCPYQGEVKSLSLKVGDKVSIGDAILTLTVIEEKEDDAPSAKKEASDNHSKNQQSHQASPVPNENSDNDAQTIETIQLPDIGDFKAVDVIEILVQVGDNVNKEDPLIALETDKATMEVPAPIAGKVEKILIKAGDKISQGDAIISLLTSEAKNENAPASSTKKSNISEQVIEAASTPDQSTLTPPPNKNLTSTKVHAGPATRRLARELGIELELIKGQGSKGRILTSDIKQFVKAQLQNPSSGQNSLNINFLPMPEIDFSQFGEIEVKPLSRLKQKSGANLHRNWVQIPHVTQFDEADITELELFRQKNKVRSSDQGIKLTPLAFFLKAAVSTLQQFPEFNASLTPDGKNLIYKKYYHIGVAVETPQGLVVPVLRDVDKKGILQIAKALDTLSAKAREGKLSAGDMQGSGFTLSSLGGIGGTGFTPIINAPDVAIMGISKAKVVPQFIDETIMPRRMLPFSLSYDHRVIDGAQAARFTAFYAKQLQDIRNMLL